MSSRNQLTSETAPLLGDSRPAGQSKRSLSSERSRFSPETLLIPVAFATTLAATIPSTTFIDLLRQFICELWYMTHGNPSALPDNSATTSDVCDAPGVAQYFATVTAILGVTEGILTIVVLGILSRILSRCKRKSAFICMLIIRVMGSCLIPGSRYVPHWLTGWFFLAGMLFELLSGLLPYGYLINMYIVDVCMPEDRTAALSRVAGGAGLGTCISFALGGFITTKTGNPFIVFYVATAIFVVALIYVLAVLPESSPEKAKDHLSCMHPELPTDGPPKTTSLRAFWLIFEPLKVFLPSRNWRLTWCGIHIFVFMAAHAYTPSAWIVLVTSKYHLTPADTGLFLTSNTVSSTTMLTLIVPSLVRFLRPYYSRRKCSCVAEDASESREPKPEASNSCLDVHLAFLSCIAAGIFFLAAAAFTTTRALILSGICLGFSSMHGPTIRSLIAGSVDPLKQGEALAAMEMTMNAGSVLSSVIMGSILTETIDTMPLLLFYVHLVVAFVSGALLLLVRDEDSYQTPAEA